MRTWTYGLWWFALVAAYPGSPRAAEEIKIGLLYPTSGIYSAPAKQGVEGATLAFEEAGGRIGSRKIVTIVEDDEAKPDVALAKAKKLVESDRVQVLMGVIWSPNAMALRGYVTERKVPLVLSEAAVRPITQEAASPYIFRTSFASGQMTHPFGNYACSKLKYRKIVVVAFDSVFGRDEADFFEAGCKRAGGAVVEKIFAPVETADFAPYFARIQQASPDAVWAVWSGAAALRFLKQYTDFGLKQKYPLIGFGPLTDESLLQAAGAAAQGVVSYYNYSPVIDSPENKRFVAAYRKRFGSEPGVFSFGGYLAARAIVEAGKAVKGELSDTGRFLSALKAVRFDAPSGKFRFDSHQNVVINLYVRKVQPGPGGKLVNAPIDVLRDVEQYWPKGKPAK
jgi:branched-chain amino acid transport system substrate-binding protein